MPAPDRPRHAAKNHFKNRDIEDQAFVIHFVGLWVIFCLPPRLNLHAPTRGMGKDIVPHMNLDKAIKDKRYKPYLMRVCAVRAR